MTTKLKPSEMRMRGWFEEYACGCCSETVRAKKDLLGYCGKHGDDRRHLHADVEFGLEAPPFATDRRAPS